MESTSSNVIFVGRKPVMSYVLACVTQFNEGQTEIVLKARGRAIFHAVNVAEIVRNKFVREAEVKDVQISTEQIEAENGDLTNVSAIEISLAKGE
jgi:archaea-specific DNA-binding protein